jgi:hypothetical protein
VADAYSTMSGKLTWGEGKLFLTLDLQHCIALGRYWPVSLVLPCDLIILHLCFSSLKNVTPIQRRNRTTSNNSEHFSLSSSI